MEFSALLTEALKQVKPTTVIKIANEARPNGDYLFNDYLPERNEIGYDAETKFMNVRSTMAHLINMDSDYPEGGGFDMSDFTHKIAKFGIRFTFNEAQQRKLQEIAYYLQRTNPSATISQLTVNILNIVNLGLVQPHLDMLEWLRGQALQSGKILWKENGAVLDVDYLFAKQAVNPILPKRTGNDGYGGTTSKFWEDMSLIRKYHQYGEFEITVHPNTLDVIIGNPVNKVEIIGNDANSLTLGRIQITANGGEKVVSNVVDRPVKIRTYGREAELLDMANKGKTKTVKFLDEGKVITVGKGGNQNSFPLTTGVGLGSGKPNAREALALGYTHIGPTVENDGRPGRWARVYRPESKPWTLIGQSVMNALPVIENPRKLCIAETEMPA